MVTVKEKTTVIQRIHGNCPTHSRTEISVRDVRTVIDEPKEREGTNMGPTPTETMVAALIACTNVTRRRAQNGHRAAAELFGIAPQTIDGLIQDLATAPIDSKLRPILAFVKKLTLTSTRMTQADADAVFAAGGDEAALHSAIAVRCLFNFVNRLVDGHGIEADRAGFAERGRKHVEMGYVAQYEAAVAKNSR